MSARVVELAGAVLAHAEDDPARYPPPAVTCGIGDVEPRLARRAASRKRTAAPTAASAMTGSDAVVTATTSRVPAEVGQAPAEHHLAGRRRARAMTSASVRCAAHSARRRNSRRHEPRGRRRGQRTRRIVERCRCAGRRRGTIARRRGQTSLAGLARNGAKTDTGVLRAAHGDIGRAHAPRARSARRACGRCAACRMPG